MKKASKYTSEFSNWSDKKLQKEYIWLDTYLDECVSKKNVMALEFMEEELSRRGYSVQKDECVEFIKE